MHRWKMKIVAFWVAEKVVWCKGKVKASSEVCLTGLKGNILPKFWKCFSSWTCHRSRADWKFMDLCQDFKEGSSVLFCFFGGGGYAKKGTGVYFYRFLLGAWVTASLLNRLILGTSKITIYLVIFENKQRSVPGYWCPHSKFCWCLSPTVCCSYIHSWISKVFSHKFDNISFNTLHVWNN